MDADVSVSSNSVSIHSSSVASGSTKESIFTNNDGASSSSRIISSVYNMVETAVEVGLSQNYKSMPTDSAILNIVSKAN